MGCREIVVILSTLVILAFCDLHIYPSPHGLKASTKYQVFISQANQRHEAFVYMSSSDPRHAQFSRAHPHRTQSWTGFAFSGGDVTVEVHSNHDFKNCVVRPKSYGYKCSHAGNKVAKFDVNATPRMMSVEFDYDAGTGVNDITDKLFIFADPPEGKTPSPQDKNVLYYGPGIHKLNGQVTVDQHSGYKEVYLAPGAYVSGGIFIKTDSVHVHGRGVLTNVDFPRHDEKIGQSALEVHGKHVTIEGITLADPSRFYFRALKDFNTLRNVKMVGAWMGNSDGVAQGDYGLTEDCFIIADDANIKFHASHLMNRRNVQWQMQNGAVYQTGWDSEHAHNVTVLDTDVIHTDWCKFKQTCQHITGNDALIDFNMGTTFYDIKDVTFKDIRVEGSCPRIIYVTMNAHGAKGKISNIQIENMDVESQPMHDQLHNEMSGNVAGARIEGWRFENFRVGGRCITNPNQADFKIDSHTTSDITFTCGGGHIVG